MLEKVAVANAGLVSQVDPHWCTSSEVSARAQWPYHDLMHYLDRLFIFFFIAASYTPWLSLREFEMNMGQMTLKVIWSTALCGAIYQYQWRQKYEILSLVLYFTTAALPAASLAYMKDQSGIRDILLGGLMYVIGTFFYTMDGRIPLAHAIWHWFVALAAFIHFCATERHLFSQYS
nr:monocyte to macrophage differentiation protein [Hymenolepis microstoma]